MANYSAILSELQRVANSSSFKAENRGAISGATREQAEEATQKLADCINEAIYHSGVDPTIVGKASSGGVTDSGDGLHYEGVVNITDNFSPSLYPAVYGYVDNMARLLNNGWSNTTGNPAFGRWHGLMIRGLMNRAGAHFVPDGVAAFNGSYGATYNAHAEESGGFE